MSTKALVVLLRSLMNYHKQNLQFWCYQDVLAHLAAEQHPDYPIRIL